MNIETKHKLVDLRSEVNKERDELITGAKETAKATISVTKEKLTALIVEIKNDYKQVYADSKAELIAENEV